MAITKPGPEVESTIDVKASELEFWMAKFEPIIEYFEARDQMNAQVHLDGVKFSPITIAAQQIHEYMQGLWQEAVADLVRG